MTNISRAMVFHGAGRPLELRRQPPPRLAEGELLVRIACCTLCGSDVHTYEGRRSTPCPTVLGHEMIGFVADLPRESAVRDWEGVQLEVGDRVTWSVAVSCGKCFFCREGLPQKCEGLFKYGHERIADGRLLSGGLADHCQLLRGTAVLRVPADLPDLAACPVNCATATAAAAMRYAGNCRGRVVLVQGAGMLGLTAAAMAADAGAGEVIVCDTQTQRLPRAQRFGATKTVCIGEDPAALREVVRQAASGRGADIAIDMSGASDAMEAGLEHLRVGGRYVWVGAVFPARPLAVSAETVVRKMLSIQGLHNYTPPDLSDALAFLSRCHARFPFAEVVDKSFALEDADAALAYAARSGALRVAVRP